MRQINHYRNKGHSVWMRRAHQHSKPPQRVRLTVQRNLMLSATKKKKIIYENSLFKLAFNERKQLTRTCCLDIYLACCLHKQARVCPKPGVATALARRGLQIRAKRLSRRSSQRSAPAMRPLPINEVLPLVLIT